MGAPQGCTVTASAIDLIGNTPLVALDRLHPGPGRIVAKAEFMQPGGSVKDRAALAILSAALVDGRLLPGAAVIEMTSGNMGAGLAVVCAALGHPLVLTMSAGNSSARLRMLEGLGAEVLLVPQVDGCPGQVTGKDIEAATEAARLIAEQRGAFYVDQFHSPEPIIAHETGTGPELWRQCSGHLDAWVAAVGTGATFIGVARFLRSAQSGIFCAAVEPEGCEALSGAPIRRHRHLIQGTGYGRVPPHWDVTLMDESIPITDDEAQRVKHALAVKEGLYVGYSAAANVAAAARLLRSGKLGSEATVATVLCDTGLKY